MVRVVVRTPLAAFFQLVSSIGCWVDGWIDVRGYRTGATLHNVHHYTERFLNGGLS